MKELRLKTEIHHIWKDFLIKNVMPNLKGCKKIINDEWNSLLFIFEIENDEDLFFHTLLGDSDIDSDFETGLKNL